MYTSFFIFRTRIYLGFIFSELICIASGMGAYPEISDPQSGCGPTKNYELLDATYVFFTFIYILSLSKNVIFFVTKILFLI